MGLKYFCDFRQLNTNELWRIEIDDPNFSGTPTQKLGAHGQTLSINWDGGDSLLSKFAIGSTATITLIFDNISEVKQFQLISDNTWKVRVYKSGVLNWQGYLISDGVQSPDSGVGFPITLTAVDGIDSGSSKPFVNAEVGVVTIGGVAGKVNSPLNWIRKCLVNNPLPIRWSSSIKNIQYIDDDFFAGRTGFIPDYDVFISSREETTTLWMLENIVKSVSAVIYQANGYWNIVSLKDIAQSSTLTFYEIDATLNAQTATSSSINLEINYPTPINESTVIMTQKPISKVKSTYEHSMPSNIIPNGGFDILDEDNKPVYWIGSSPSILIEDDVPINNRIEGRSARFYNLGTDEHYVTFSVDGINSIPLDANLLFKEMEWGFTFMPVDWAVDVDGFIDWTNAPLQVSIGYTGYEAGKLKRFYLNQFGFWDGRGLDADILQIDDISYPDDVTYIITFSGTPEDWQVFKFIYFDPVLSKIIKFDVPIETGWDFTDALSGIASATGGTVVGSTIVYEFPYIVDNFSASFNDGLQNAPRILFTVEDMKNLDVATVSFQSKGNQGRVLFPNPRVLDQMRALDSGKLSIMVVVQPSQQFVFDDLYMNVSSDKEYWDITDGGNDGLENYELGVSSSFSGFMTSSYMDNFATSDLSMIMTNGVDTGTLTEIFGKTALRMLSTPISKIDVEFAGAFSMFNIIKRGDDKFLPLTVTVNPETNETSITMFELKYNSTLALTSTHKSTGSGNSVSGGGGSFGGGSGGGGDITLLSDLLDVNISGVINNQVLTFNTSTGKWENKTFAFYTKTEIESFFAGTTGITGYNKTTWDKIDNGGAINNTVAGLNTARTLWGQSFDGTANVSGSLTSVTDITGSGLIKMPNAEFTTKLYIPHNLGLTRKVSVKGASDGSGGVIPPPPLTDVSWGMITGTLSSQTDLKDALDGKVSVVGYNKAQWDTAYSWGNPSGVYAPLNGVGASGTWGINITGSAASATVATSAVNSTQWAGFNYDNASGSDLNSYLMAYKSSGGWGPVTSDRVKSWLGLGNYAYRSSGLAELTGATFTGALSGTSATFSGSLTSKGNQEIKSTTIDSTTTFLNLGTYAPGGYGVFIGGTSNYAGSVNTDLVFGTSTGITPTEKMRLTSSGNLGLGVTPSAWFTGLDWKALQIGGRVSAITSNNEYFNIISNGFRNSSNAWQYITSAPSALYSQNEGRHEWQTAPSGTAGNAISFTQAMTLDASGRLGISSSVVTPILDATTKLYIPHNLGSTRKVSIRGAI